ncbi:VWA domain-containing protein [Terasakiella pusilla]|uniref:VWA domain-containing protein n=1 Tax=Terasakiella pusilla TaxID=64973 RepID=UPI003AA9BDE2
MLEKNAIMRCLPILANVLGRKYGIRVEIGGKEACTDGTTIHLPDFPIEADDVFLGLVRGYIDHEAAHIRYTDFALLQAKPVPPLVHHVWNILEDWRVEQRLSKAFPGCRGNFDWLIRHLFLDREDGDFSVLSWLLLSVRGWSVPELDLQVHALSVQLDRENPGLRGELEAILQEVRSGCPDTAMALSFAKRIVKCLEQQAEQEKTKGKGRIRSSPVKSLQDLIHASTDQLPNNVGETIRSALGARPVSSQGNRLAVEAEKPVLTLSPEQVEACRKASIGMRSRFEGLWQTTQQLRVRPARSGKLSSRRLHRMATAGTGLFMRAEDRPSLKTVVHILLDASGSMQSRMDLATAACHTVVQSLYTLGLNVGVTAFPGKPGRQATVMPLLRHGQRPSALMRPKPTGGTPLGEAVWWLLPQLYEMRENRKIVVVISDGEPDDTEMVKSAIKAGQALGLEFVGLGIASSSVERLMPESSSTVYSLNELVPALLSAIQKKVLR